MGNKNSEEEKQSAAKLLTMLLRYRRRYSGKSPYTNATERHIKELCSTLLWKHSESDGKHIGCKHWSTGARASKRHHGKIMTSKGKKDGLIHEHLFPRNQLIEEVLFCIEEPTIEKIRKTLDRLNIGVVITNAEHQRLDKIKGTRQDPWERYRKAGIVISETNSDLVL